MNAPRQSAWYATLSIMEKLRQAGHVAYLAGGCVRDKLLGRTPKDYDIATSARPDQVCVLFPKARLVGAKFGVVLVRRGGHDIEVATFRTEGKYSDGRHPDEVTFGNDREDALRRDFTINGLFYDPFDDRVIDYVDGQMDLGRLIVRTIGSPDERFSEDHLRMLRAIRIAARLGFTIESETAHAIARLAPSLEQISPERIWMELEQILTEPTRECGWSLLIETGLRPCLSTQWPAHGARDEMAGKRLGALPDEPVDVALAMSAVLADNSAAECEAICRSLRLSSRLTERVAWLTSSLPAVRRGPSLELADFKALRASDDWPSLLELLRVELVAQGAALDVYHATMARAGGITLQDAAPAPLLSGDDLLAQGYSAGPQLGRLLREVYRAQLNETIKTKAQAFDLFRRLASPPPLPGNDRRLDA